MWLSVSVACTWISPAEHAANMIVSGDREESSLLVSDDDDDDDDDNDDGVKSCDDDALEPNDRKDDAIAIELPDVIDGRLCPASPVDWFSFATSDDGWLSVRLSSEECEDLLLQVETAGSTHITSSNQCPHYAELSPEGVYIVGVGMPGVSDRSIDYTLDITHQRCDGDIDGFDTILCDGTDCDDAVPAIWPGAPEVHGNGLDEDCDGGDDLAPTCAPLATSVGAVGGTLACGDLEAALVWDRWEVSTAAGGQLTLVVHNDLFGFADPLALLVAPDGTSHYGLASDRSQLDDELTCGTPPWSGGGCPGACLDLGGMAGTVTVWVAQQDGSGCIEGAGYSLDVSEDGEALYPVLVGDDIALGWP